MGSSSSSSSSSNSSSSSSSSSSSNCRVIVLCCFFTWLFAGLLFFSTLFQDFTGNAPESHWNFIGSSTEFIGTSPECTTTNNSKNSNSNNICMYIYIYICVHVCVYIFCIYIYIYTHTTTSPSTRVRACCSFVYLSSGHVVVDIGLIQMLLVSSRSIVYSMFVRAYMYIYIYIYRSSEL